MDLEKWCKCSQENFWSAIAAHTVSFPSKFYKCSFLTCEGITVWRSRKSIKAFFRCLNCRWKYASKFEVEENSHAWFRRIKVQRYYSMSKNIQIPMRLFFFHTWNHLHLHSIRVWMTGSKNLRSNFPNLTNCQSVIKDWHHAEIWCLLRIWTV